ncbi:hypothetical protein YPPY34_3559, partial [Yersinia pestis PY-34]|jgi:hypothetical protein
MSF